MYIPDMTKLYGYFYLYNNKVRYEPSRWFPYEHYIKQGRVSLFNAYEGHANMVVVKPRNIYFSYTELAFEQIAQLCKILSTQDWQKHALCNLDLNNYPEIFI